MLEQKDRIVYLFCKRFRDELTQEENKEFEEWLSESEEHRNLLIQLSDDNIMEEKIKLFLHSEIPNAWAKVQQRMNAIQPAVKKSKVFTIKKEWQGAIQIAATAIFLLTAGIIYYVITNQNKNNTVNSAITKQLKRLLPKINNRAELTLCDGSRIPLHEKKDGLLNTQGAFQLYKHQYDLYYKKNNSYLPVNNDLYNILTTPPGGQYRIILADHSTIAMNVASSVKFNVSSSIRNVELNGEAEFDIEHNQDTPFVVMLPAATNQGKTGKIEVTGTRFNINSYKNNTDEKIITLIDGLIKISTGILQSPESLTESFLEKSKKILKPGDQALLEGNGNINITHNVDTAAVVSWKKGYISFNRTSTIKLLNTLKNWYDVKIVNKTNKISECLFTGKITPETDIETVLEIMQFQCDNLNLKFDPVKKEINILP